MRKKPAPSKDAAFLAEVAATNCTHETNASLKRRLLAAHSGQRLPEAAAVLAEIISRLLGCRLYDSQLLAARALQRGAIVELATGEGKTLAAILPAVWAALDGQRVHILTWNDYLAERDYQLTQAVYAFCGLTSGFITAATPLGARRALYQRAILYTTVWQVGYDTLRDFLALEADDLLAVPFDYALVDEADAIMLDAAVNPLVIARPSTAALPNFEQLTALIAQLPPSMAEIDLHAGQVSLTEEGLAHLEKGLKKSLYAEDSPWPPLLHAALTARFLLRRDRDYLVQDGQLRLIDPATGRQAPMQQYPHLLQTALELKEGLTPTPDAIICQSITIVHLLQQYAHLSGMTATALSAREQFGLLYQLPVEAIAPHFPTQRLDHPPLICPDAAAHQQAILETIQTLHRRGQPLLIGTRSVAESEQLSRTLTKCRLPHQVLNAKNDAQEAAVIAQAGQPDAITISTNMAGRGVDIPLTAASAQAGGLYILGTGFYPSDRQDDQLRGRAGRHGEPGASRFFIDMSDPAWQSLGILRRGTPQELHRLRRLLTAEDDQARLTLLRYNAIVEKQRRLISQARLELLHAEALSPRLSAQAPYMYQNLSDAYGSKALANLEKQLLLRAINDCWSDYLESLTIIREGIHLTIIGRQDPLDEYHKLAIAAFDELRSDIISQVLTQLASLPLDGSVLDLTKILPPPLTTVLTYRIDESRSQFSALPRLSKAFAAQARGALFTLRGLWQRFRKRR